MSKTDQNVIETQMMSKSFGDVHALQSVNLRVPRNSIFGFLGPNGAGKTTLMKILLGLSRPSSGSGKIFGLDIQKDSVSIRERIGYLPQHPRFIDYMTARENLDFAARFFFSGPDSAIKQHCEEMLELVGLTEKADRPIKGFSGGEKQRLGIALAQVNYPDLLILDEPAAALDPLGRHQVLEIMERLQKHTTIFYSTHILDDVQSVSDTVAILKQGQLVAQGPIEQLLQSKDGVVYKITIKNGGEKIQERLSKNAWISSIDMAPGSQNGRSSWQVCVNDETKAESQLLRLILQDESIVITDFNRKKFELEEIFIDIVKG